MRLLTVSGLPDILWLSYLQLSASLRLFLLIEITLQGAEVGEVSWESKLESSKPAGSGSQRECQWSVCDVWTQRWVQHGRSCVAVCVHEFGDLWSRTFPVVRLVTSKTGYTSTRVLWREGTCIAFPAGFLVALRSSDRNGSCLHLTSQRQGHTMKSRGSYLYSEPAGSTVLGGEQCSCHWHQNFRCYVVPAELQWSKST